MISQLSLWLVWRWRSDGWPNEIGRNNVVSVTYHSVPQPAWPDVGIKGVQFLHNLLKRFCWRFNFAVSFSKSAIKVEQCYLGRFCSKICCENVSKQVQSGHTALNVCFSLCVYVVRWRLYLSFYVCLWSNSKWSCSPCARSTSGPSCPSAQHASAVDF